MTERSDVVKVNSTATISFGSLCWLTWLVFLILKITAVLPETFTWFWVWFPFWLPIAIEFVLGGMVLLALFIIDHD